MIKSSIASLQSRARAGGSLCMAYSPAAWRPAAGSPAANTNDCTSDDAVKRVGADGVARYTQIPEHTRQLLAAHYAPFNRELEVLVNDGRPFWPD